MTAPTPTRVWLEATADAGFGGVGGVANNHANNHRGHGFGCGEPRRDQHVANNHANNYGVHR